MNKYNELEMNILACLLIKPELMEQIALEDKHFVKHQRMWKFMKAFYSRFKTFDMNLMYSISKDKYQVVNYVSELLQCEPDYDNFNIYQEQLKAMFEESKKNKWIIDEIFQLANDLFVRKVSVYDFKDRVNIIFDNADRIFKKEE